MKNQFYILIIIWIIVIGQSHVQPEKSSNLIQQLPDMREDTHKVKVLHKITITLLQADQLDSALLFIE